MAVYGLSLYGQDLYGLTGFGARAGKGFASSDFAANPTGLNGEGRYGQVTLSWTPPVGDWSDMRIMRLFSGFPNSVFDGVVVHEGVPNDSITKVVDSPLTEGVTVYYSMFVKDTATEVWFKAGEAWSVVVEDYLFHELLQDALPNAVIRSDYEYSLTLDDHRKNPLLRFLEVPAFELDRLRTYIESLEPLYNPDHTPAQAVTLLLEQFGITPEPSIGISRLRTLARNASYLNRTRGTRPGVEALASAFTGWGATLTDGINLMLREDPGTTWTLSGTATFLDPDAAPVSTSQWGVLMGDTAAVVMRTAGAAGRERFSAVPVEVSTAYTFSFEAYPETTTEDFTPALRTYELDGTFINEYEGTPVTVSPGGWTQVDVTYTSEANAAFMEPVIKITGGTSGDEHHFRNLQLEEGSSASTYEPARQVIIDFAPPFTNYITTPSFENAVLPAFTTTNATQAFDATYARFGADSWRVTPTTGGIDTVVESNDTMPVQTGDPALARVSVRPDTTPFDLTLELVWLDAVDAEVARTSQVFSLEVDAWNDMFLVEQAPSGATKVKVSVTWQDVVANIDAVALIDAYGVEYFDGDSLAGETFWEATTPHNQISYYYPLRQVKSSRLSDVLPNYLPLNRSFTLKFAEAV